MLVKLLNFGKNYEAYHFRPLKAAQNLTYQEKTHGRKSSEDVSA